MANVQENECEARYYPALRTFSGEVQIPRSFNALSHFWGARALVKMSAAWSSVLTYSIVHPGFLKASFMLERSTA